MGRVAFAAATLTLTIPAVRASGSGDEGPRARTLRPAPPASPAESRMAAFGSSVAVGDGEVFVGEARTLFRPGAVYIYRKGTGD